MNDMLLLLGLIAVPLGIAGAIKPLRFLRKSRWISVGLIAAGSTLAVLGMCSSDDGCEPGSAHMLLDDYMPEYDIHEIHAIRIQAPPENIYASIKAVTIRDLGVANVLTFIRSLPAHFSGRSLPQPTVSRPLLRLRPSSGFFLLAEEPYRELVLGFIGQFWKPEGGDFHPISSPAEFLDFNRSHYAKAAWNFYIEAKSDGTCRLSTETRVMGTDPEAKRNFRIYWSVIYPGSAYIRRVLLKAVKRRAEAH